MGSEILRFWTRSAAGMGKLKDVERQVDLLVKENGFKVPSLGHP